MRDCRLSGIPAALALLIAPISANAQSCYSLSSLREDANRSAHLLKRDNPGITAIAIACSATADADYKQSLDDAHAAGTFAKCGAGGCLLVTGGYGNCIDVGTRIIAYTLRVIAIERQMRRQGCDL